MTTPNTVPNNVGLAFVTTTNDNTTAVNRIMNGAGHKPGALWASDAMSRVTIAPTTIAANNSMAVAGKSFLSNSLAGITPMTFANTTISAAAGRGVIPVAVAGPAATTTGSGQMIVFPGTESK